MTIEIVREINSLQREINKIKARSKPIFVPFDDSAILAELANLQSQIDALQLEIDALQLEIEEITPSPTPSDGGSFNIRTVTASDATDADDYTILADATSGNITVTLSTLEKRFNIVKKIDSSVNLVTIVASSGLVDGESSQIITKQWTARQCHCDGTDWFIV